MKKILALILAMAMVLGMSVTSLAAAKPKDGDAEKVTINNVEEGATFKAYQIIDADYNDSGFVGYVWAEGTEDAGKKVTFDREGNVEGLTDALITELAANPGGLTVIDPFDPTADSLTAGTWMILVTPPANDAVKVYNPMVVSVYYSVDGSGSMNEVEGGMVDAAANWTLETTDAFAKSSEITLTKDLDNPEFNTEVKVGDEVPYTITSEIPSYDPTYYKDPTFKITDTIVNGLKYTDEPKVYGGQLTVPAEGGDFAAINADKLLVKDRDYTLTYTENSTFTVAFTKEYIQKLVNSSKEERTVTVKYSAVVLDSAVTQVGENKATLEFSRTPEETDTKEDKEYVFTFALHGVFYKVDEAQNKLPEAVFGLYVEDKNGTEAIEWAEDSSVTVSEVGTYTTSEDGEIKFKGLDGDKVYYLKETKAPNGYSINDTIYKIKFEFDKADDYDGGNITYTVVVTDNKGNGPQEYTVTYGEIVKNDEFGQIAAGNATNIPNTKISSLPSTGGIGTTIFTVGGCAIMIIAAGLFFATRRKKAK